MQTASNILTEAADRLQEQMQKNPNANVNMYMGKARIPIMNNYVLLFYNAFDKMIDEYSLSRTEIRTMLKIMEYMRFGNLIQLSQKKMAEDLKIDRPFVSRIMKRLKNCGLLIDDGGNLYLNPQIIAKGRFMNDEDELLLEKGAEILREKTGLSPSILTKKLKEKQELEQCTFLELK